MADRSWRRRKVTASLASEIVNIPIDDESAVTAAVGSLFKSRTKTSGGDMAAEEMLRAMYRDGRPAVFGALVDIEASQVAKLRIFPRRIDGKETPTIVSEAWTKSFRGIEGESAAELIERGVRQMRLSGRFAVVFGDGPSGAVTSLHSVASLTAKSGKAKTGETTAGYLIGRESKDRKAPASMQPKWVPEGQVRELWVPDDEDPSQPWTPYARCVEPLRTLRLISRRVTRETNAYLAGSRALWMEGSAADLVRRQPGTAGVVQTPQGRAIDAFLESMEANLNDTTETETRSAATIPIVWPTEPRLIELSRPLDQGLVEFWDRALKEFALATPWPTQWVVDGTGAGNHWSDWLTAEEGRSFVLFPIARQFCGLLSVGCLRPILKAFGISNPEEYVLDFEAGDLDTEPLTPEQARQAWADGLLSREAYARILGLDPDDMLPLPANVDEFEFWSMSNGSHVSDWWTRELQTDGKIPYEAQGTRRRTAAIAAPNNAPTEGRNNEWWN